jgi:excisionase family DNA binding protein
MDTDARLDWGTKSDDLRPIAPLLLTPEQAAASLGICRTKVYQLIGTGRLESVRIGTSRRIAVAALEEFIERLRATAA